MEDSSGGPVIRLSRLVRGEGRRCSRLEERPVPTHSIVPPGVCRTQMTALVFRSILCLSLPSHFKPVILYLNDLVFAVVQNSHSRVWFSLCCSELDGGQSSSQLVPGEDCMWVSEIIVLGFNVFSQSLLLILLFFIENQRLCRRQVFTV